MLSNVVTFSSEINSKKKYLHYTKNPVRESAHRALCRLGASRSYAIQLHLVQPFNGHHKHISFSLCNRHLHPWLFFFLFLAGAAEAGVVARARILLLRLVGQRGAFPFLFGDGQTGEQGVVEGVSARGDGQTGEQGGESGAGGNERAPVKTVMERGFGGGGGGGAAGRGSGGGR
jgi:hypothetical protein